MKTPYTCIVSLLAGMGCALAQDGVVSEQDFFREMPVVLSVSRLPQRQDETPGAVTVIDQDMIRRSGARSLVDVLRLVPGFQTSNSFEGDAPQASYHGSFNEYANRIQVLVDGRSVYSPFLMGSSGPGLQTVALQDIDRIEVLQGSNSAAYGARAFLGVINIRTRDAGETLGWQIEQALGENGIRDSFARYGWGADKARFRLSLDSRGDDGLSGANGHNRVSRLGLRADLQPQPGEGLEMRVGGHRIESGLGFAGQVGKPPHDRSLESAYLQFDWRRSLSEDADWVYHFSHTKEVNRDNFPYALPPPFFGVTIDFGGTASNDTLSAQYTRRVDTRLRYVVGAEWRQEQVTSRPLYNTDEPLTTQFTRVFGNAEWRLGPSVVLNAGAMVEDSSIAGSQLAPRVMLNWHLLPGHTLRLGSSQAHRPPSTFERYGNVRYVAAGTLLQATTVAKGQVGAERIEATEIGYLGNIAALRTSLDARLFREQIRGFIRAQAYTLAPGTALLTPNTIDYINAEDYVIEGFEYQLKWQPWRGAQFGFSETHTENRSLDLGTYYSVAPWASSFFFMQKLPGGWDVGITHHTEALKNLLGDGGKWGNVRRTDLRVAKSLQFGAQRGELAAVVQNLDEPFMDFHRKFTFGRRAFLTLSIEH